MERMNYINRPKSAYTQEERIEYLEKSLRELRTEKDEIRKEKGEYRHKILRLEEENKKLKEDVERLIKLSEHKTTTIMGLGKNLDEVKEENKKLKSDLEETKNTLEHRDSFFSIMRDVLANETITNNEIAMIVYCVVHFECGDTDMSKKEVEIAEKFWFRDYV